MQALLVNKRMIGITVSGQLEALERDWVVGVLASLRGVERVSADERNPRRLFVDYDADRVSGIDLLDYLQACGVRARATLSAE